MAPVRIDQSFPSEAGAPSPIEEKKFRAKRSRAMHRSFKGAPSTLESTSGNYLQLDDGAQIFDASGGAAVSCLGYRQDYKDRIIDAWAVQARKVPYCPSSSFTTPPTEDLTELLCNSTVNQLDPESSGMDLAFLCCSGSSAIEAALKIARQYHLDKQPPEPSRAWFISREASYHGNSLGSLSVSGHVARREPYEDMLSKHSRCSPCDRYRGLREGETDQQYVHRLASELTQKILQIGPENVSAFIAEPVSGAALGAVPPVPGYFKAIRAVCDKYGVLLILDEVMCGAGRIGPEPTAKYPFPMHAWQDPLIDTEPDIMVMAKGLGSGFSTIGAMLATAKVTSVIKDGPHEGPVHGETYAFHSSSAAAALEVQRIVMEDDLLANVRSMGAKLGKLLKKKLDSHPNVGDVRGKGLLWGIEFVKSQDTKERFEGNGKIAAGIQALGLSKYRIQVYNGAGSAKSKQGDHILLAPAYTVNDEDVEWITDTVASLVHDFFQSLH